MYLLPRDLEKASFSMTSGMCIRVHMHTEHTEARGGEGKGSLHRQAYIDSK